jgi:hypothetical protein
MRGLIGDLCIKTYLVNRTLRKPVRSLEKTFLDSYMTIIIIYVKSDTLTIS